MIIAGLITALLLAVLLALTRDLSLSSVRQVLHDRWLWHVLRFTFWQAALSTLLAVLPALWLAGALWRRQFPGRALLLRLCSVTLILPALVVVFGLVTVYGREGWLASLLQRLHLPFSLTLYGLPGILLAHTFFNLPLATRLLLQALTLIPTEERQLAASLGMNGWQTWRLLFWPWLKRPLLAAAALVFTLCFSSFAIVLTLGGGPRTTTLELAIYQALYQSFDLPQAALLALLQLFCCLLLTRFTQSRQPLTAHHTLQTPWQPRRSGLLLRVSDALAIFCLLLLLLPPLLAVVVDGLNHAIPAALANPGLWRACATSLLIATAAGLLALLFTLLLLWSSRQMHLDYHVRRARWLELSGMTVLAMPALVLSTGLFLLFNGTRLMPRSPWGIVIIANALLALPYTFTLLMPAMYDIARRYSLLCQSLGIHGLRHFQWLEWRLLAPTLRQAFGFAALLSLGDFGVIALWGNPDFMTLPWWLYQQMGAYRTQESAVSALVLLVLAVGLFFLLDRTRTPDADAR